MKKIYLSKEPEIIPFDELTEREKQIYEQGRHDIESHEYVLCILTGILIAYIFIEIMYNIYGESFFKI